MSHYKYLPLSQVEVGSIVERVSGPENTLVNNDRPPTVIKSGDIFIVKEVDGRGGIKLTCENGYRESYNFKLIKTKPVKKARCGDKVICIDISVPYGTNPIIGNISKIIDSRPNHETSFRIDAPGVTFRRVDFLALCEGTEEVDIQSIYDNY